MTSYLGVIHIKKKMCQIIQTLFRPFVNNLVFHNSSIFEMQSQLFTALNRIFVLGVVMILKDLWVVTVYILKTIKNATDIQVISTFQGHLERFVYSEVSLPLARELFSEN